VGFGALPEGGHQPASVAGEHGTLPAHAGPRTIEEFIAPTITEAAARRTATPASHRAGVGGGHR